MPRRLFWIPLLSIAFISACVSSPNRVPEFQAGVPAASSTKKPTTTLPPSPTTPAALSAEQIEIKKLNVLRRIYELTDDMLVYCAAVPRPQRMAHQQLVKQFWTSYPHYRQLLLASPDYPQIQAEVQSTPNKYQYSPEVYQKECQYYQDVLREWMKDPKDIENYLSILNATP